MINQPSYPHVFISKCGRDRQKVERGTSGASPAARSQRLIQEMAAGTVSPDELLKYQAFCGNILFLRQLNDKSTGLSTGFQQRMWKRAGVTSHLSAPSLPRPLLVTELACELPDRKVLPLYHL
jgi:hypothetical protein